VSWPSLASLYPQACLYDDEFLSQISDEAKEFLETHGEQAATSFFKIAKGEGTPLRDLIDTWLR
jgi:hypothetical protein